MATKPVRAAALLAAAFLVFCSAAMFIDKPDQDAQRAKAEKAQSDGNYKDAYEIFSKLVLDKKTDPNKVGQDLWRAIGCLQSLNRQSEMDAFREEAVKVHAGNWRFLMEAAQTFINGPHHGYIVAGEFHRGYHRGGGQYARSQLRDRVRALQLLVQAMEQTKRETDKNQVSRFYSRFAEAILMFRSGQDSWRLQYLTDLSELPDYEEGYYYGSGAGGAPVDEEGDPVFHKIPESWDVAKSDGERWRWLLDQALELAPGRKNEIHYILANFLHQQFGVQTMARYGGFFARGDSDGAEAGTYTLHTLKEDETMAKLAVGVKRFKLPDEFNFIRIFREISEGTDSGYRENAWNTLAQIFENRRQYDKAAECWQESIERHGPGSNDWKKGRLDQIVKNWGTFEPAMTQPSGKGATIEYRFRNGAKVGFEAHEIDIDQLLEDAKTYLKSNPKNLDGHEFNLNQIGYRLIEKKQTKYVGKKVASWSLDLEPRKMHFDKRITVTTPLQKAGAYLLTAEMEKGNKSQVVIWVADMVIAKKPLQQGAYYFVADARTGEPVPKANVEFFGYRRQKVDSKIRRVVRSHDIVTRNFSEFTDANGQVSITAEEMEKSYYWVAIARTDSGRLAFLGFSYIWYSNYRYGMYDRAKCMAITDRPVYRPNQTVKFKCWIRRAKYDHEDRSLYANQSFELTIKNPKGEVVLEKNFTADAYGGFDGELALPKDATLGVYRIRTKHGGGTFRVEEYKKPEFEVLVEAPSEPVMLGDEITAKVQAKYYFGAPVTNAKVKIKVLRSSYSAHWYPVGPWDWFYGSGYWWFGYDYTWYPGWYKWGCFRPIMRWSSFSAEQPEVVMEHEQEIGEDGTLEIKIDTAFAKEVHGDQDHRYEITVEVTDESRRTIVGQGQVLAGRKPFKVYTWVDSGYYRVSDTVRAHFTALTLDQKPVTGKGKVRLLKIAYGKDGTPEETVVQTFDVRTNAAGKADLQFKAAAAGQYRLSCEITDAKGHTEEGGYIFVIRGEGFDGSEYRFNDIEIIADRKDYAPGDKVKLMINTNRADCMVMLFLRPINGVYLMPEVIRMNGKSRIFEIEVTKGDMPNFFVEALTVSNGKVHTAVREIVVPPEKRVLTVDVMPSTETYKPGEEAKVRIRVKDFSGKPFSGSAVVTVYDKSVEYISGGSNVAEIKAYFWKWRRNHNPRTESNLAYLYYRRIFTVPAMSYLGAFGHLVADTGVVDEEEKLGLPESEATRGSSVRGRRDASDLDSFSAGAELKSLGYAGKKENGPRGPGGPSTPGPSGGIANTREAGWGGDGGTQVVEPTVRTKFADTAFWAAAVQTDADGFAEISLTMPENLTTWKIKTWAMGHGTRVGEGSAEVQTTKNLLLRLQAPRFFVEKDEVVLSANIHNYLDTEKAVKAVLELEGGTLEPMAEATQNLTLASMGEVRVDWRVKVIREGEAVIRMKALSDEESDAMEMRFPVYVHGMAKTVSFSGGIRSEGDSASITIDVPEERRINDSRLEVRYSPTLAAAMVDALPYLAEYPYGCTEQTLNRFVPAVITQKILLDIGMNLEEIRDKQVNLNAQQIGDPKERAAQWKHWKRNPVFDEAVLKDMVKAGLERLGAMQLSDGGWGWFSGWGEHSSAHTTAVVVHGLQVARYNDMALVPGILERGIEWLKRYQAEQVQKLKNAPSETRPYKRYADNLDAFVYMVLGDEKAFNVEMRDFLYRDRTRISVYAKAMFALALHKEGQAEKRDMLRQNIEQFLVEDNENQTCWLNLPGGWWWYWYGSEYEAQAYYLKLLAAVDPQSEKASGLAKYLINNRRNGTYWRSTRDTALCIEALSDYMRASGEAAPDMTVEIYLDGRKMKEVKISKENLFSFDGTLLVLGDAVESGKHTIEFKKTGTGPLYFNAYLTYFSLEDFITKAGLEIKVNRKVYKLVPVDKEIDVAGSRGQALKQKVEKYEREELENWATLKSGDLVEVELTIDSKNDYEYIVFEDMKAAGFEPVEVRSGYLRKGMRAYMELRDERVAFFVENLARGKHSVSYRLRAEIPGAFSALPTRAFAMYAPELKANSDEIKLKIED